MKINLTHTYDFPLRVFHLVFSVLFLTSFSIAKFVDDESIIYAFHMISGLVMSFMIFWRIYWGFFGEKTSKFSDFKIQPQNLKIYFENIFNSKTERYLGHNPATSFVAIAFYLLTLGLGTSGVLMVFRVNKHFFEEFHELAAHLFLFFVLLHVAGLALHEIRHKDRIYLSIFTGKKLSEINWRPIESARYLNGFILIFLIMGLSIFLASNLNFSTGVITIGKINAKLVDIEEGQEIETRDFEDRDED